MVRRELGEGAFREARKVPPAQFTTHLDGKVLGQFEEIAISRSQGWQVHNLKTHPIQQIPTKLPCVCHRWQVRIGCPEQTDIDLQCFLTADPFKLAVFDHAQ